MTAIEGFWQRHIASTVKTKMASLGEIVDGIIDERWCERQKVLFREGLACVTAIEGKLPFLRELERQMLELKKRYGSFPGCADEAIVKHCVGLLGGVFESQELVPGKSFSLVLNEKLLAIHQQFLSLNYEGKVAKVALDLTRVSSECPAIPMYLTLEPQCFTIPAKVDGPTIRTSLTQTNRRPLTLNETIALFRSQPEMFASLDRPIIILGSSYEGHNIVLNVSKDDIVLGCQYDKTALLDTYCICTAFEKRIVPTAA